MRRTKWLTGLFLFLVGCLRAPTEEPEHHVPAHRPADFPAAVARLQELHRELPAPDDHAADHAADRPGDGIEAFVEWSDLVRWLPELAADSDLPEAPWNRVDAAAAKLAALLPPTLSSAEGRAAYRAHAAAVAPLLEELAAVVALFPRAKPGGPSDSGESP